MGIAFDPKRLIPDTNATVEILKAVLSDAYGPQLGLYVKVVGGEHDGHTFMDYSSRDETTGNVKDGTKAWSIFRAALGPDFYKVEGVDEQHLVGKQIVARITSTKTGSRNKLEAGTIGPIRRKKPKKQAPPEPNEIEEVDEGDEDDDGARVRSILSRVVSRPGHNAPASPFREKRSQTMMAAPNDIRPQAREHTRGAEGVEPVGRVVLEVDRRQVDEGALRPRDRTHRASSTDPTTWSSYEATEGHEKIGFVFTEDDPYCGIDLDDCIDPETGKMSKEARLIVGRFASYTEVSPSGTGVKIFVKARVPGPRRKNPQKRMEIYDRGRFFAITGHLYGDG